MHLSNWPSLKLKLDKNAFDTGEEFANVVSFARQEKAKNHKSLKEPIKLLKVNNNILKKVEKDLKAVTYAENIEYGKELKVIF